MSWLLVALSAFSLAGCTAHHPNNSGSDGGPTDGGPPDAGVVDAGPIFIALDRDFANYNTWQNFTLDDPDAGLRNIYIKQLPPHGSTSFPVGTIIVKEAPDSTVANGIGVHAMVKRGGGFNDEGATNWEWFDLINDGQGNVTINWRGATPPVSGGYGGPAGTTCNDCHEQAYSNDFVQTPQLKLSNF
jgi:hypothetical protein